MVPHPFGLALRRREIGPGAPEWVGVAVFLAVLAISGWMMVACFHSGAWPVGIVGCLVFVAALFITVANVFPERRQ